MGAIHINTEMMKATFADTVVYWLASTATTHYGAFHEFRIYKGPIPTGPIVDTYGVDYNTNTYCMLRDNSIKGKTLSDANGNLTTTPTTAKVTALLSGIATHFLISKWNYWLGYTGYAEGATVTPSESDICRTIHGSVGAFGSGSDIEIRDPNIVAGQQYFMPKDIKFTFPLTF